MRQLLLHMQKADFLMVLNPRDRSCRDKAHMCYMSSAQVKVKSMQSPGTEAMRTEIQPSKPKWEITKITNSQNTKRKYIWSTEGVAISQKVASHRNSDTKNRQQRTTTKLPPWNST